MTSLSIYLPQDRVRSLASHEPLPDRTTGAALFADISGFTPLTENLTRQFGARRGLEELTRRINAVYDAIIGEVEGYGGSVISFAGDAITCWFDAAAENSAARAVAAALSLQAARRAFPDLSLKVAVTSGEARRFVVGDPALQWLDTLAGETITRLATAEHLTQKNEVAVDQATVEACRDRLRTGEWRTDTQTNERFAVVLSATAPRVTPPSVAASSEIPAETLRAWVPPTVFAREAGGLGEFLTELRPAVALFLNFSGIDYDGDVSAQAKLDAFIRQVQHTVARYAGTLLQLTIGDKGSYVYVCFGAPTAHEDDARRAVNAALALREMPRELTFVQPVQIGLSHGILRIGASGGTTRRTYSALGDEVNLAARLMSMAAPNEILVSGRVQQLLGERFSLEPRPPLPLKGKAEPLPVFAVTGAQPHRATRLLEPAYRLPMIGRQSELNLIDRKLDLTGRGQGQIVGITAEAGMGKSRLVAETIRLANRHGFAAYGGACESSGTNTAYLAWKAIWQAFFDVDPAAPARRQLRNLENEIEDRAPGRLQAMPLLSAILDLPIDDNDFTRTLEPKDRRNVLAALFEDCLRAAAKEQPILFVLEDVHWIDPLSRELLESLARATANSAVCFVLAYRPPELDRSPAPRVQALPNFTQIALTELTVHDAGQLVRAKLAQLYPERGGGLPVKLFEQLTAKAQGNPFFIEELLNYLRDRAISPYDEQALTALELPSSLHTLILSRMDQLTETQKATLKVASVIGRLFSFAWLQGYYPTLGAPETVKADLEVTARLDITPLDTPEPELAYLFKHIVTQEVAYESLAYATRAQLHDQLAHYLEASEASSTLDLLAFHYGRSENAAKQREYFRKAGKAAQANFANDAALDYYGKLLPLLTAENEQAQIHLQRGQVLELMGKWIEAEADCRAALELGQADAAAKTGAQLALGRLCYLRGNYDSGLEWLAQAKAVYTALEEPIGLAQALIQTGRVLWRKGQYAQAREPLSESLVLARGAGDKLITAQALDMLGNVADSQGDYAAAQTLYEESLLLIRELGDKGGLAGALNSLGIVAIRQGSYPTAQALFEESQALDREMGDKRGMAMSLNNLGILAYAQGDTAAARASFEESLVLCKEMDDKTGMAYDLLGLGLVGLAPAENSPAAREHILHSLRLRQEMGEQLQQTTSLIGVAGLALHDGQAARAAQLLGAAESALKALHAAVEVDVAHFRAQTLAAIREQLGEEAFNATFEAGQKMTLAEAVKFALEEI